MQKVLGDRDGELSIGELERVLRFLVKQTHETKLLYFRHQGVVKDTRRVPDHRVRLRALVELAKLYGLYPRRGERESSNSVGSSERPIINLVMPSLEE